MTKILGPIIDACTLNRESVACRAQDTLPARRPDAITKDMVDPHPTTSVSLYSDDSWRRYWTDRLGAAGGLLARTVFHYLEAVDVNPGDGYLDLNTVPRDTAESIFNHLHPLGDDPKTTQRQLDAMRADVERTQKRLVSVYVAQDGGRFIGTTETGVVRALVAKDVRRAWEEMRKAYPDQDIARVIMDAAYFAGRETDTLNPDRKGVWAPMLYSGASIAASGGIGVFDPSQDIVAVPYATRLAGLGPGDFDNFIVIFSVGLLFLAKARRGGAASLPAMAMEPAARPMDSRPEASLPPGLVAKLQWAIATRGRGVPTLFMSGLRRAASPSPSSPASEPPGNQSYRLPNGVTMKNTPVVGRSFTEGKMTMRPISRHERVLYVVDTEGVRPREGFSLLRETEGLRPLFIPVEMVRKAVRQDEMAQTSFRAPHELPSIPFRDTETGRIFRISPSRNLNPVYDATLNALGVRNTQPFDPYAQITGVVVKNDRGEPVLHLPWVDGWMTHSPMAYRPLRDAPHNWIVPEGWNGDCLTLSQRTDAAARLLSHIPQMQHLTPNQQGGLATVAASIVDAKMDAGIARWAVNAVLHGRRSTTYLTDYAAEMLRQIPQEWIFDRPMRTGKDRREALTPEFIMALETGVARTHNVFPALHDVPYLFPCPDVPSLRTPRQQRTPPVISDQKGE